MGSAEGVEQVVDLLRDDPEALRLVLELAKLLSRRRKRRSSRLA
jgi:hypothetical protein